MFFFSVSLLDIQPHPLYLSELPSSRNAGSENTPQTVSKAMEFSSEFNLPILFYGNVWYLQGMVFLFLF